jgi:hypothetical protein
VNRGLDARASTTSARALGNRHFGMAARNLLADAAFRRNIGPMNKIMATGRPALFDADYARRCAEQGSLLRSGRLHALDRGNLAEEIESLGRSDGREIESKLKVLLVHPLGQAGLPDSPLPAGRPFAIEEIVDPAWLPEAFEPDPSPHPSKAVNP